MSDPLVPELSTWTFSAGRALIEGVPDGVMIIDSTGAVVMHNQAAATLFGVPAGELIGDRLIEGIWQFCDATGAALDATQHPVLRARDTGTPVIRRSTGVIRGDGPTRWVHASVRPLGWLPGLGEGMAVVFERAPSPRSGSTLHSLSMDLDAGDAVSQLFGQRSVGMVHMRATDGVIIRVNEAFATMLGRPIPELLGVPFPDLLLPEDMDRSRMAVRRMIRGGADHYDAELRLLRADGSSVTTQIGTSAVRDGDGRCESLLSMVVDVSRLRRAEHFMSRRALFDPLTQLINRPLLIDLLSDQLRMHQRSLAVIALNLDRFKAVNDSLGQATGDGVLVQVAERLRAHLQPGDAAARISGDDFVLLLGDVTSRAQGDAVIQRILDAVAEPIDIDGLRIQLTASAGVSLIGTGVQVSADEAIFQATTALGHAKAHGRARWKVFDTEMQSQTTDRLQLETSLRRAVADRALTVAYQPLQDIRTGATVGAEALVRWHDPGIGTIPPLDFLPVAEETGLIVAIGQLVLGDAMEQVRSWRGASELPLHVSVNLSPNELNRPGIIERVVDALEASGLPADALWLEITESVLVDADQQVRRNLSTLRGLGVIVGLDDFGTGYASMSYLKTLPIDFVKIDQSFVAGLATSREDRAIVHATLELAKALDLQTVGEGIETQDQYEVLAELGCDIAQGYLIGRPAEPEAMSDRI